MKRRILADRGLAWLCLMGIICCLSANSVIAAPLKIGDLTPDASVSPISQGPFKLKIAFTSPEPGTVSASPLWEMAGFTLQYLQMAPGAELLLDHTQGIVMIKVMTGELKNLQRGPFAEPLTARTTRVSDPKVVAGENGAMISIVTQTSRAPLKLQKMEQAAVSGPMSDRLVWKRVDALYEWGKTDFAEVPFYNLAAFQIYAPNGSKVANIQFWTAGLGVNCGNHDHSDNHTDPFCEIHQTFLNGTDAGGMVYLDDAEPEVLQPLPSGFEHGPHWHFDPETGSALQRADHSVVYPSHRWQAGGDRIKAIDGREDDHALQSYDLWAAYELMVSEATMDLQSRGK